MTLEGLNKKFDAVIRWLDTDFMDEYEIQAVDMVALSINRVQEKGINKDGTPFSAYSTEPIYINPNNSPKKFTPLGKNKKSKFKNGNDKLTRYFSNGYKGFRSHIGQVSDKKVFTLTGEMFKSVNVLKRLRKGNAFIIEVGPSDELNKDKMQGHNEREKTVLLYPNAAEIDILQTTLMKRIARKFNES